ncbi:hypothetical protein LCGC14_1453890 [marine sediment metagenome]|uniref:Uncharacterized protein n=1 Tax=marine sediment metagenome TaxID=412755 RepID=A0A0F9JHR8_9ZZZZ
MAITSSAPILPSISKPPSGGKQVKNIWVTPEGKLEVEYEDTPNP